MQEDPAVSQLKIYGDLPRLHVRLSQVGPDFVVPEFAPSFSCDTYAEMLCTSVSQMFTVAPYTKDLWSLFSFVCTCFRERCDPYAITLARFRRGPKLALCRRRARHGLGKWVVRPHGEVFFIGRGTDAQRPVWNSRRRLVCRNACNNE